MISKDLLSKMKECSIEKRSLAEVHVHNNNTAFCSTVVTVHVNTVYMYFTCTLHNNIIFLCYSSLLFL